MRKTTQGGNITTTGNEGAVMTKAEFLNSSYGGKDKVEYKGLIYDIYQVDFEERLFAINQYNDEDNLSWVRCENVEFIPWNNHKALLN